MAKTKISEFSTTAGNNTDINSINIAEGCAPSGINDAIRELMRQLKEFQTGGAGDSVNSGGDFSVATNKFTVASASGNTAVAGTLAVTGTTTLTGALVANGNATLGDGSGDTVTVKGTPTLEVNPTLSGGTANGVLYLNGSKVATSGSALTFDGTNLGIGVTTAYSKLQVAGTIKVATGNAQGILSLGDGNGSTVNVGLWRGAANAPTTDGNFLNLGGYEGMVFAVGAAAIGSQSEQMRLTSTGLGIGTSSPGQKLVLAQSGATSVYQQFLNNSSSNVGYIGLTAGGDYVLQTNNAMAFYTGASYTERMRLDSSGNLGLGVTPSAWSLLKALQIGNTSLAGYSGTGYLMTNAYFDGSVYRYTSSNYANLYTQNNSAGQHAWYTASSGTAGDAITFTQAMTLDASGNLAIGQTSASRTLDVKGYVSSTDGTTRTEIVNGGGVGYFGTSTNHPLAFQTNNTERARIDSSGNFLFNQSSAGYQNSNSICNDQAGFITINHIGGTSSGTSFVNFGYGASGIGSITQSGTTAVAYNTTSDQRLKENIVDAPEFGSVIDSIKVRSYDWKADGNHQRAGFVAQELVTVAPEAVHQPADPEEMMAVDYSKLVPMLVKEIQSLRARVAQLESN